MTASGPGAHEGWWNRPAVLAMLVLASMVPLVAPPILPLIDLPGHMGRYRVQLDYAAFPALHEFYAFHWALIGNLGVDLLIVPMAKVFGLEAGTKLIVLTIPALTVTGLLWISREVHERVAPTALFALPLAYGYPFMFGFVNFALSMALALNAFALWLRLARLNRLGLRAMVFLVIGPVLWLVHTFGWAMLCVLAFSAELVRQHDRNPSWLRAMVWAGVNCLPLAPPVILMLLWRSEHVAGFTGKWFRWSYKWDWLRMTLRDRWAMFDQGSVLLLAALPVIALFRRDLGFSRHLAASMLLLALVFVLLPRTIFGSAYADMRLTPYLFAVAVIAIRFRPRFDRRWASGLAMAGAAFFAVRTAATTVSLDRASDGYARVLAALDHVPDGARLASFVGVRCTPSWSSNRMEHLPAMAIVRRRAFSNDQWDMAGAQLLTVRRPEAGAFRTDPSQMVTAGPCPTDKWRSIGWSLTHLPRDAFDYVWLIDAPPFDPKLAQGMTRIWQDGPHALYRIDRTPRLGAGQ